MAGKSAAVKLASVLVFGLFFTSLAHAASANEVIFTCDYELGATDANRKKIGSVAIAIDVNAKTAKIDFGKGWFKTMTLLVDGADLKEAAPPTSGEKLGFFYFDLTAKRGGFTGGSGLREFFDACLQKTGDRGVAGMPREVVPQSPPTNSDHKDEKPATAAKEAPPAPSPSPTPSPSPSPSSSPTLGQATTEYFGGTETRTHPAWAAEATMNPNYRNETARTAAAAAVANKPAQPQTGSRAVTEFYGGMGSSAHPAWAAEATMNPDYDKEELPKADSLRAPPAATPVGEASAEPCRDVLSTEAAAAKLYFANASFVVPPDNRAQLKKIAKIVKGCKNVVLEVAGYTDNVGNPANNKRLSLLRANGVVEFLIAEGAASSKLKAIGYGEEQPIATNTTLEGRRLNRRIEIRVSGK